MDCKDFSNRTPLDYAIKLNYSAIVKYLFDKIQLNLLPTNLQIDHQIFLKNFPEETNEEENLLTDVNHFYPFLFNMIVIQNNSNFFNEFVNDHQQINLFDSIDYDYRTIAHYAANRRHLQTFQYLSQNYSLDHFIQIIFQEDRWNLSAIDQIFLNNHFHLIQFLNEFFSNNKLICLRMKLIRKQIL
jgi:ankyrin repeat protein